MVYTLILLIASLIFLLYIYGGYFLLLKLIAFLFVRREKTAAASPPSLGDERQLLPVTIFVSAHNEEEKIQERLENLLQLEYPKEKLEIIVVSDGSTDNTVRIARDFIAGNADRNIRIIEFKENRGRSAIQNKVASIAKNEILISTDAETSFTPGILKELMPHFSDSTIGVVGAKVIYLSQNSSIGEFIGLYRDLESAIRNLENKLGLGFQTDGPCVAYRKNLWEPIFPYEDVDQVISLIARKKGYRTVQADQAIAFDRANETTHQEIKSRARMTRKGLFSKLGRWGLKDVLRYPGFSFALFSHKILRYFSPLFVLLFLVSGTVLAFQSGHGVELLLLLFSVTLLLGMVRNSKKISCLSSLAGMITSFFCANAGFGLGILQWMMGNRVGKYEPTRKISKHEHRAGSDC